MAPGGPFPNANALHAQETASPSPSPASGTAGSSPTARRSIRSPSSPRAPTASSNRSITGCPSCCSRRDEAMWLDPVTTDPAALSQLLKPYPAELMEGYCVSRAVNSPMNDSPSASRRTKHPLPCCAHPDLRGGRAAATCALIYKGIVSIPCHRLSSISGRAYETWKSTGSTLSRHKHFGRILVVWRYPQGPRTRNDSSLSAVLIRGIGLR